MLTDLAVAARKSGLRVIELEGWKTNRSPGGEAYRGVGIHHTGSYDSLTDATNDRDYARWMAFEGRDDLDPPLMNLGLSAESVVYVGAAGNANGMGEVRATGPMPAAGDGNGMYIVIEAMNSGTQGWGSKGRDAHGVEITQYQAYVRLCAALCKHYKWPASHVRAHWETSVTGKWDPGDPKGISYNGQKVMDMNKFRAAVAREMKKEEDDMPAFGDWPVEDKDALASRVADEVLRRKVKVLNAQKEPVEVTVKQALARIANGIVVVREDLNDVQSETKHIGDIMAALDQLNEGG